MKKVLFVIVLLLVFALLFSACDENKPSTPETPATEHTHTLGNWVTDKAATCTEDGQRHQICSTCGETIKTEVIPAGHTEVIDAAVAPTCTQAGLTEGKHCSVCNKVLVAQQVVPATGHSFGAWVVDNAPTCTAAGSRHKTCTDCGDTVTEELPATGHQFVNHVCTVCGKTYSQGLAFTSNGNGTCYVSGIGTCTDTDIVIPPVSPNGDSVTSIGGSAFYKCTSLASVTIPGSVAFIGNNAFYKCTSLASVTIPGSVAFIGNNAFSDCTSLTSITIPDSVTSIERYAFSGCASLTSITIPDGVTFIGHAAFYLCTSLTSIEIPDSVTSIGEYAFSSCTKLTSISIPDSVTSIGEGTFSGCFSLRNIVIPDSVTSIEYEAFNYCPSLTSITVPDSVTNIGSFAFRNCYFLKSIVYQGTIDEWNAISKAGGWNSNIRSYTIHCTDGDIAK